MISKIIKSRILLLVIVPIFLIWIMLGYYYSLGKLIKTDNAYVKAPIISVQSEVSGKIKEVLIKNNQFVKKDQILLTIDDEDLSIKLIENEQTLKSIEEEIKSKKSKLNEIEQEILIAREDIKYRNNEENRIKNLINNKIKIAESEVNFFKLEFNRQLMLTKKGFGIKKNLEDAKFKFDKAKTNLISLNLNKEVMIAGNIQVDDNLENLKKVAHIIDISGGLETEGLKDISKIEIFLNKMKNL